MNQQGVALIQVLLIAAILSAVATQLAYRQQTSVRSSIVWLDQRQGLAWLNAVESLGLAELKRHAQTPFPQDYWGNWSDEFELEEGGAAIFRLERLQGRYNLNWLHTDSGVAPAADQVDRLFESRGEDSAWLSRLSGWMNAEQGVDLDYRARTPGYRASGLPITHKSEIGLLQDTIIPLPMFNETNWAVFLPPPAPIDLEQVTRETLTAIWPQLSDEQWGLLQTLVSDKTLETPDTWLSDKVFEAAETPPTEWFVVGNQYYRFQGAIEFRERFYWQTSWIYRNPGGRLQVFKRHRLPFPSPLTDDNGTPAE